MKPRLVVNLIGGLGNQLFQYACAWSLAKKEGRELLLDTGGFEQYKLRPFLLERLKIKARRATQAELDTWGLHAGRWARIRRSVFGVGIHAIREKSLAWQNLYLPSGQDVWLNGYWQSERYFESSKNELKVQFAVRTVARGINGRLLKQIQAAGKNACCIHVRRGDYVSSAMAARIHGTIPLSYYAAAVARLRKQVKGAKFFVFSDDPIWARENLAFVSSARFLNANPPDAPEQDLRLMSACRHFILANSSFSWWGAWLGEQTDSIVMAPRRWFNTTKLDDRDLLPTRWYRIDAESTETQ